MIARAVALVDPAICAICERLTDWTVRGRADQIRAIMLQAGAILIALGMTGYATNPSIVTPLLPLSIGAIWLGVILSPCSRPPLVISVCVAIIALSALIAIPLAEHLPQTLILAWLTVALVPLVLVRNKYIWMWFTPVWVIHAAMCFWQWYVMDIPRVDGITSNANTASALLLIGCVYLLNGHRLKWTVLPLLVAILFTGSRWTAGVASLILLALFATRYVNWKYIAVGAIVAVGITLLTDWQTIAGTFIYRQSTLEAHLMGRGLPNTSTETAVLSLIPQGLTDNGIHSVPWRMMHETGILSGIAWIVASVYGLCRYPKTRDSRWWMLLAVVLISALYYDTWVGPLAGFWWLLVRPTSHLNERNNCSDGRPS